MLSMLTEEEIASQKNTEENKAESYPNSYTFHYGVRPNNASFFISLLFLFMDIKYGTQKAYIPTRDKQG